MTTPIPPDAKRTIVCGSRSLDDYMFYMFAWQALDEYRETGPLDVVVSGGAAGPDRTAIEWANSRGVPCEIHYAEWSKYGKRAGMVRNKKMLETADAVIAFWDGESRGTKNMIEIANAKGIPVKVIRVAVLPKP